MSSGSCKFSNAASNVTASTFFHAPRSYYRHSNHFRSSSYVPTGTRVNSLNESHSRAYSSNTSSGLKRSTGPGGNFDRAKFSGPASGSSTVTVTSSSKMDSSTGSSAVTGTDKVVVASTAKAAGTAGDNNKAAVAVVNGETVRSLATNLESSLSLNSANISATSTALNSSSNNSNTLYNGCQTCNDTSSIDNTNNNSIASETSHHTISHANSSSDSSKSINGPKFGTPVPNRVFVGGIPLDATEYDVRQLFAQYGNISSVKIISDRAGVSRGYGFVTYDSEEDAQKVIKEAENLIIKHRRLNVSTAVMKHQQSSFGFDPRMIPSGSFIYPQLPFNSAANFSQFYPPDNFHSICAAEGLPLYQLAGMNGHSFMSNCPSFISPSTANYLNQTAAAANAFSAPYQSPTSYIYPGMAPGPAPSLPLPSQHSLFQSQQAAAAAAASQVHLLAATSLPNAFQYSPAACGAQQAASSNSALHAMRYPMPPSHPHSSPGQTSQPVNMNASSSQQYIQFSSTTSPAMSHPSMHLATSMALHQSTRDQYLASLQMNSEMANSNSVGSSNMSSGGSSQLNAALLHHAHHSHPHQAQSMYANYQTNLAAAAHSLAANSNQMACMSGMHLKTDGSGMEMLDNVSAGMMNGMGGMNGTSATNSSAAGLASLPATVHLSSNGGYMPQMMEVIWPSSHLSNAAAYCSNAPIHLSNTSNGPSYATNSNGNSKLPHQAPLPTSNNRSISSVPVSSSNSNSNNAYAKSSHNTANLPNGHSSSNSSTLSAAVNGNATAASTAAPNSGSTTSNQSNTTSSKEKVANARHNTPSYGPSHKKMHNGNGNGNNNSHNYGNNGNNSAKSKAMNGNAANGTTTAPRYQLNSVDSTGEPSPTEPPTSTTYSGPASKQPYNNQKQQPPQPTHSAPVPTGGPATVNGRVNGSSNSSNGAINGSPQAFVTKTVNGVQIYALASNGEAGGNGLLDAPNGLATSPPVGAVAASVVAFKA